MLYGIKQTDSELNPDIQHYGCLFLCFAESSPMIFTGISGKKALNQIWEKAIEKGYISGDLNGDGDLDDDGEAIVLDHTALAREFFALNVHYDGKHHKVEEDIPKDVAFVFGRFVWKFGHFVIINKRKEVTFDSLGYSNSVKYGTLKDMRYYYAD